MKYPKNVFGVNTIWDRLGRDFWLLLNWVPFGPWGGLWLFNVLPAFYVNMIGTIFGT